MVIDYALVGRRIAEHRKQQKMTQEKLAEKAEISSNYLSHIETSRSIPSLETVVAICDALQITPDAILIGATTTQNNYMLSDMEKKLAQCTDTERRIVMNLIDVMIKERTKK